MDLWLQFKWRGGSFPGNIKLEAWFRLPGLALLTQLSLKSRTWKKTKIKHDINIYKKYSWEIFPEFLWESNETWHKSTFYFTEWQGPKALGIIHCEHGLSRGTMQAQGRNIHRACLTNHKATRYNWWVQM